MILGILCFDLEIWISVKNQEIWVAWAFSTKVLFVCVSVYMTHELAHTDDAFIVIISHFPSYVIKMKTAIIVKLLFLYTYTYAYTTFYLRLWIMMDITHEALNVFSVRFFFSLSFTILGLLAQLFRFTWVYTNECETHGLFPFACVAAWFFFSIFNLHNLPQSFIQWAICQSLCLFVCVLFCLSAARYCWHSFAALRSVKLYSFRIRTLRWLRVVFLLGYNHACKQPSTLKFTPIFGISTEMNSPFNFHLE